MKKKIESMTVLIDVFHFGELSNQLQKLFCFLLEFYDQVGILIGKTCLLI